MVSAAAWETSRGLARTRGPDAGESRAPGLGSSTQINSNAGSDAEAPHAGDFLLLYRTGNRDLGLELRKLLDRETNLFHVLPSQFFYRSMGKAYATEALKLC